MKAILKILTLSSVAMFAACGSSAVNSTNSMSNSAVKADNANMPAGMAPVQPSNANANAPGIPTVIANVAKGATPTPGIPSPEEMKKPVKKGATPTPGIPSPEEIRKQMGGAPIPTPDPAASQDSMMKPGGSMMKKNTNKLPTKPQ